MSQVSAERRDSFRPNASRTATVVGVLLVAATVVAPAAEAVEPVVSSGVAAHHRVTVGPHSVLLRKCYSHVKHFAFI